MNLFLDCSYGISGDMTVASLLDLGANREKLLDTLKELNIDDEYEIKISKVLKAGVEALDFNVILKKHSHHRNLNDVNNIIDRLNNQKVKELAKKIFLIVAESEAKAHNKSIDEVHFHEVGATDSIIDIVSAAFCIEDLNIENVYVPFLNEGVGYVECAHGKMKVPVPAVINIKEKYDIPLKITDLEGEMVTPTGIAIVAALRSKDIPKDYEIIKTGVGAGKRYPDRPSVLKSYIIEKIK